MDPLLPQAVAAVAGILLIGIVLRGFGQPHVVAYIAAGVLLGPHGFGLFTNALELTRMGDVGVVLLLFFVGMEVSLPRLARGWRIAVVGTGLQVVIIVGVAAIVGWFLDWDGARVLLVGFAMAVSSTAVVFSLLRLAKELDTPRGRDAVGILLAQDVALVPMLVVIGLLAGDGPSPGMLVRQVLGGLAMVMLFAHLARGGRVRLPYAALMRADHEFQVFAAFLLCFGMAALSGLLGLSAALGAFAAGVLVAATRETEWIHRSLEPMRVLFVALFFVSVGLLLDVAFLADHAVLVAVLVLTVLVVKTGVNAVVIRLLGRDWRLSLKTGAMLAQVGEFSFVLVALGRSTNLITDFAYQVILGVIVCTLALSPFWIGFVSRYGTRWTADPPADPPADRPAEPAPS